MGRCGAPCTGAQSVEDYAVVVADAVSALSGDSRSVVTALRTRMGTLAEQQRFEDAGTVRDRLLALVRGIARVQRIAPLAACAEIIAAKPAAMGGWELVCVRHGRLAATTVSPRGADPMPYVQALRDSAEVVLPAPWPSPAATPEETEKVLRWLESPGVRIVDLDGEWTCPVGGAGGARAELEPHEVARREVAGFVAAS
jgi:DNA polymerase-3 subunit epsilon